MPTGKLDWWGTPLLRVLGGVLVGSPTMAPSMGDPPQHRLSGTSLMVFPQPGLLSPNSWTPCLDLLYPGLPATM